MRWSKKIIIIIILLYLVEVSEKLCAVECVCAGPDGMSITTVDLGYVYDETGDLKEIRTTWVSVVSWCMTYCIRWRVLVKLENSTFWLFYCWHNRTCIMKLVIFFWFMHGPVSHGLG